MSEYHMHCPISATCYTIMRHNSKVLLRLGELHSCEKRVEVKWARLSRSIIHNPYGEWELSMQEIVLIIVMT